MKKLLPVVLLFLVFSCTNTKTNTDSFQKITPIEKHNWQRFAKIEIEVPVHKNDSLDFYFIFQYNDDFKAMSIPVNISFYTPGGEMRSRNYRFSLVDKKTKKKLGTTENNRTEIILPIRKEMPFIKDGTCKVIIEKKIPSVDNFGIEGVGLKAVRSVPVKKPAKK
jgi:hypothetical protein